MKSLTNWVLTFLLGSGISSLTMAGEGYDLERGHGDRGAETQGHEEEGGVTLTEQQKNAAGIVSEPLSPRRVVSQLRAPGETQLNAYATIKVTPRIAAQIIERHVVLGDAVDVGQPLVTLSSVDMAQAQGDLLVAAREWRRVKKLGRDMVSEQRYTEARVEREQARARAQAYGMTAKQVDKLVESGNAAMANGRFQLLASQAGTVISDDFIVGALVAAGQVLFEVSDESMLWVEARLMPEQADQVRVGASASVVIRGKPILGEVIQVFHALDERTRTLGVRIQIPNLDDRLHPGLFVQALIDASATEQALVIPTNAILRSPDGDWQVFIEHEPNEFEHREIKIIRSAGDLSVIEGLDPGVNVVVQGVFFLQSELAKSGFSIHNH
jgi:RND family efflux transporter MFP subunit